MFYNHICTLNTHISHMETEVLPHGKINTKMEKEECDKVRKS